LHGREILPETLRGAGAQVTVAPVYQNSPAEGDKEGLREELLHGGVDMITFTSSSTVRNFLAMIDAESQKDLQQLLAGIKIAAIGPITAKTVTDNGLRVDVQPEEYTIEGLIKAIVDYYSGDSK
jgi:uroporphyrinogen III methyltransferase/synthase